MKKQRGFGLFFALLFVMSSLSACRPKPAREPSRSPINRDDAPKLIAHQTVSEEVNNLQYYIAFIEDGIVNEEGFVEIEQVDALIDAFYEDALLAYEAGVYDFVEKGSDCVYLELKSGIGFVYTHKIEGFQAGTEFINILTYQVNYSEDVYYREKTKE